MARGKLTSRKVETLGPGRHYDGAFGLYLQVRKGGARYWCQRVTVHGRRRDLGLGPWPVVSLAEARARALENLRRIERGEAPVSKREEARRRITFREATERHLRKALVSFRNAKHRAQWRSTLETYAFPVIGDMPVDAIGIADVLRVLEPIWETKPETASRLRGRIEAVLASATVAGYRDGDNPARWKGNLEAVLPSPAKLKRMTGGRHQPAVALADAPRWWQAAQRLEGMGGAALRFLALTLARPGEVTGARWDEVDLEAARWTIPAARMKAGREHVVPLSAAARALLEALPRLAGTDLLFPGNRARPLSDNTLRAAMRRLHEADLRAGGPGFVDARSNRVAVPHGLRSTFRDWCAETGQDRELAEMSLAHVVGSATERAYRRGEMIERRRALLENWSSFLERRAAGGAVVPLVQGRAR